MLLVDFRELILQVTENKSFVADCCFRPVPSLVSPPPADGEDADDGDFTDE